MEYKKIAILGYGVTGQALLKYFYSHIDELEKIEIYDQRSEGDFDLEEKFLNDDRISFVFGTDQIDNISEQDLLLISPSTSEIHPTVLKAREIGVKIHNDVSYFISIWHKLGNKCIGVTGSNGKSTVVSLIHGALESAGVKSILVGNIGQSPLDYLSKFEQGEIDFEWPVIELSSYQLESFEESDYADIAVITNISPNHLDHHNNSMIEYVGAKLKIIGPDSIFITVTDDGGVQEYVLPHVKSFKAVSLEEPTGEILKYIDEKNRKLKGLHNLYNIALTLKVLEAIKIDPSRAERFLKTYSGLEHRVELVRNYRDSDYINDSKSTSPDATRVALETFGEHKNIILIAGGTDKKVSFDMLKDPINQYVKCLIILDHDINEKLQNIANEFSIESIVVKDMHQAIEIASQKAESRDIVLLSPAAASLGKYKNFEERGKIFKDIVNSL